MKKIAYYALHYGKEYLAWSIRSVQEAVDEIVVLYAPEPSYGHRGGAVCPDSEGELRQAAARFQKRPIHWVTGGWSSEEAHRNHALQVCRDRGAELVLVVDADELWLPDAASAALAQVEAHCTAWRYQVRFKNFFRSLDWLVEDHFMPYRIVDFRSPGGDATLEPQLAPVYHFGYAQSLETMRYKWTCHGHQAELRSGWMDRYEAWRPQARIGDLHPVVNHLWREAVQADEATRAAVTALLADHPYFGAELIE